ncbi:hypothetical protein B0H12DRAFT_1243933 [Mycena haematopus]|nr:hypothetical protein B0H12DRAFT_1243933 [Mycena haematopus]
MKPSPSPVRSSHLGAAESRYEYAAPTLEPPKAYPQAGRRTRSGAEFSPFATVALALPTFRLSELLAQRDNESDSEPLSDDEDAPPSRPSPTRPSPTVSTPSPPSRSSSTCSTSSPSHPGGPMPGSIIRCARPEVPLQPRTPGGPMPGSIIRCARPPPSPQQPSPLAFSRKASRAEIKARRLIKKHVKDRAHRRTDLEQRRVNTGPRLKLCAELRVRSAVPIHLDLRLAERFHAPVASSGWQADIT